MENLRDYSARVDGTMRTLDFCRDFMHNASSSGVRLNKKNVDIILRDLMDLRFEIADGLDVSQTYLKFDKDSKTFIGVTSEKRMNYANNNR